MELFRLHVENLGRIEHAELGIRPLTVFVGPNNTNKTWTAYALYGLAQRLSAPQGPSDSVRVEEVVEAVEIDPALRENIGRRAARFGSLMAGAMRGTTVVDRVLRAELLENVRYPTRLTLGRNGLRPLLSVASNDLGAARVGLTFDRAQLSRARWDAISLEFTNKQPAELKMRLAGSGRGELPFNFLLEPKGTADHMVESFVARLVLEKFPNVVAFPAERKALAVLSSLLSEEASRSLSLPLDSFVARIRFAAALSRLPEEREALAGVVTLLEDRILAGRVAFESGASASNLAYVPHQGPALKLQAASSLVRALSGLDVYLKFLAEPGDLIVIDEPEMNAHPEAQLMIAELLGVLVNRGINVLITTHSPYFVDHINNLVEAAQLDAARQNEIAGRFQLRTREAFLPAEKVAAYLFNENGRVDDIFNRDDRLIDWATFGNTSERVSHLFNDILELAPRE